MTRGELRWRLTVPDDGSLPAWREAGQSAGDGLLPTLIHGTCRPIPASACRTAA